MNWNQWKKEINEHKWNSKNCLERDLNPRPRLSSAEVLTTTPPRQPRYRSRIEGFMAHGTPQTIS